MEKLVLGEYEWISYREVKNAALSFGRGIRFSLGQEPGTLITIFAEITKVSSFNIPRYK